jgi:hypothetical protein
VLNAFASPRECVRFDVVSEGTDLETVVTAPNGTIFRNDDSGQAGCFLCPTVKIASAPNNGWYTARIAHFSGAAVNANFALLYGRYNAGNPNCAGATTPTARLTQDAQEADEAAKAEKVRTLHDDDLVLPPRPRHPGHN